MDTYLEVEVQDDLCKRLFLSFVKRAPTKTISGVEGKVIKVSAEHPHIPSDPSLLLVPGLCRT